MKIAAIIPAYNAASTLRRCLRSILAGSCQPHRLVVVDDGSTDETAAIAASLGAEVLCITAGPLGPAVARNQGARRAEEADIVVFLDADTVVHDDTLHKMITHFTEDVSIDALFGSYDMHPEAPNVVSRYKNLVHHYVHQTGCPDAATFWAGCGAVRRGALMAIGGFNQEYSRPSVEDIELGMRLRRHGYRIRLCPDVQVTHLKRWSLWGLWVTDIFRRAIPWTRLIIREGALVDDLNISVRNRVSAASCIVLALSLTTSAWFPGPACLIGGMAAASFVALNWRLLRFFFQRGGLAFTIAGAALHILYNVFSLVTFVSVVAVHHFRKLFERRPIADSRMNAEKA